MSVTWVAGSTAAFATASSITASAPAGITDNDVLLAAVFGRSTLSTPAGWTKLIETASFQTGSLSQWLAVFAKTAVTSGDAGASFSFTQALPSRMGVVYAVLRGAAPPTHSSATANNVNVWTITPTALEASAPGSLLVAFGSTILDGASTISPFNGTLTPSVPNSFIRFSGDSLTIYRLCGAYRTVSSGESNSGAFDFLPGGQPPLTAVGSNNGLGTIVLLFGPSAPPSVESYLEVSSPLTDEPINSLGVVSDLACLAATASPLGAVSVAATHDFYKVLSDDPRHFYTMQLQTSAGAVRVPISSWQATLHVEDASFVQCVVPAADQWVDDLGDADSFVIFRKTTLLDGREIEGALAGAPLQTLTFAQGGFNSSATLQGYLTDLALDPDASATPTLRDVQTVFTYADGIRVRCAIDWQLRPGMTCYYGTTPIVVEYINYYVTQGQVYMDVGGA